MPCSYNYITSGSFGAKPDYTFSRKLGILLPYYNYQFSDIPLEEVDKGFSVLSINNLIYKQLNEESKIKIDEHVRLFYVALTRAENAVYIVGDLPKLTSKALENQRNKDRPYGMLSYMPHYILLDDQFIKDKISKGIVKQEDYDLYLKYVSQIKLIKRDLTNDDLDEVQYERYSKLWQDSYLKLVSDKILDCVLVIERQLYQSYVSQLAGVNDYDILAQLFASHYYNDYSIHKVDDLLKERKKKISDDDEDIPEDLIDIEITEDNVYQLLDAFKAAIVERKNLPFLGLAFTKKMLESPKAIESDLTTNFLIDNLLLKLARVFDNQLRVKSISFACDSYLDKTEVFDYRKHPPVERSYIPPKLADIKVSNDPIVFKQREHLKASKTTSDEELPSQEVLDYGTYLHRLLELVDLKTKDTSFIKNEHDRKIIDKVLTLHLFDNLDNASIYQEYNYYDEELLSTGCIDLLIVKDDHYYIIDYKAKHTGDEAYIKQLHTYQRNVKQIFNIKDDTKTHLYLLSILDCKIIKVE